MDTAAPAVDIYNDKNDQIEHVAHEMGLEMHSDIQKNQNALERLIEWASLKGAHDKAEIVSHIKELANRIGRPTLGGNFVKHLSTYAYLEMERLRLDRELSKMEKKDGR